MSRKPALAIACLTLALGACGEDPEREAARRAARRDSCIAEELAVQAVTRLREIETMRQTSGEAITATIYPFTLAQHDFAKARERELALLDSAAAAATAQDSAALARRAAAARPAAPTDQVRQNAAEQYQRDFALALGNPAHPCNLGPEATR
jgi:hypothetical protein